MVKISLSDANGVKIQDVLATEKTFSSGNTGFFFQGKIVVGTKRYQTQVTMVEIKPKA